MTDPAALGRARADLVTLEAQLPPASYSGALNVLQVWEPFMKLFNAIAAVRNRIRLLEEKSLPAQKGTS